MAKRGDKLIFAECKYLNRRGKKSDVKVSLYFKSRFVDIDQAYQNNSHGKLEGWLITNTRFTTDAIKYALCAGIHLLAWDYPPRDNLKDKIEVSGLYPITCITNFTSNELVRLMADNVVLCKSINENPEILDQLKISKPRRDSIMRQCNLLCRNL